MTILHDLIVVTPVFILVSLGLMVILGLMNIVNLAHTGFMAVAVYAALTFIHAGWNYWLAGAGAVVVAAVVALVVELIVVKRLYGRHVDDTILATWGISLILLEAITSIFGRSTVSMAPPHVGNIIVRGLPYSWHQLILLGATIVLVAALAAVMHWTRFGLMVRMVMTNEPLALAVGVNTKRVQLITFVGGAVLAAIAGVLLGPTQGISPAYAVGLLAPALLIVMMSGRTLGGLVIACLITSLTFVLVNIYSNAIVANVMIIGIAVVVLRIKPEGLTWHRV